MVIRRAAIQDISRIAEILVFVKRINFRPIFKNDEYSFGELQVLSVAKEYSVPAILDHIWVYDDGIVKGMIHIEGKEIKELYVDAFFQNQGIGAELIEFAKNKFAVHFLWAIEKNEGAIRFYESHGFHRTDTRKFEEGTTEYLIMMEYAGMTAKEMWSRYCAEKNIASGTPYEVWAFCGGGPDADELASLVLEGTKTATASLLISYEAEGIPLPEQGCYSVILYDNGKAAGIIRDTKVSLVPFHEVSEEHAYKEGEGTRTLEEWREIHRRAFAPDYDALGREFDEEGVCVLEEFELVYPVNVN